MQAPLMSARRRKRLEITRESGTTCISLGQMEIWDGADLSLIRDTLFEQIQEFQRRDIGLDLRWVKYIPSGFFGMLSDWHDRGIRFTLIGVQENVRQMVWFRQFFREVEPGKHILQSEPQTRLYEVLGVEEESDSDESEVWTTRPVCDHDDLIAAH